jgi:hypothetical protein
MVKNSVYASFPGPRKTEVTSGLDHEMKSEQPVSSDEKS